MEFIEKKAGELYTCSSGLSKSADQFGFGYPFANYGDIYKNISLPILSLILKNKYQISYINLFENFKFILKEYNISI